jgi:hypothetical protein
MSARPAPDPTRRWPHHGWLGLALVAIFWPLNWALPGMRTHWGFFPLWLGYCLTVDALVLRRRGTSLLARGRAAYAGLFVASIPVWWLFEAVNARTRNWFYEGRAELTALEYVLFASWSFSTVIPAVFETAELCSTFRWLRRLPPGRPLRPAAGTMRGMFAAGALMLALLLAWPRFFFPLVWLSLWFLLEPLNVRLGNRSLLDDTARGDWRPVAALALGALLCGFFWEMWNFWSYPKWHYRIPFVDFGRVFEMPILGYAGYVPFAWELFALYHLLAGRLAARGYVQVGPD